MRVCFFMIACKIRSKDVFSQSLLRIEETVQIDIVLDRYDVTDSIKSMERSRRVTNDIGLEVKIHNLSTPLSRQWDKIHM